jgi:predicted membrane GTPase involved in stress response
MSHTGFKASRRSPSGQAGRLAQHRAGHRINDDELVEVVPDAIRVRKRTLDHRLRKTKAETAG